MFNYSFRSFSFKSLFVNLNSNSYINVVDIDVVGVESCHLDARIVVWNTGTNAERSASVRFSHVNIVYTNTKLICSFNVIKVFCATLLFIENINIIDWNHPSHRHRVPCICSCSRYWVISQRLLALLYRLGISVYKQTEKWYYFYTSLNFLTNWL